MEYVNVFGLMVIIHILTMSIPGINFIAVTQASIRFSKRMGIATAAGIATGALIWASAAAFGIGLLFETYPWMYHALKWLGGGYILYIGAKFWFSSKGGANEPTKENGPAPTYFRSFLFGLMTNLSNPKSILLFGSIFTTVLHPVFPQWVRITAVLVIFLNVLWWHTALALLFSSKPIQSTYIRHRKWMNRLAGFLFILFGLQILIQ
ncbi:LysE family transporter [Thalassobacillus pellis]|uniref:LysE family transporter n=1 Tax=Thalassobacillus pellis TaxID=748008 RepID=UPI001961F289|nr:LysE family transporter [Thalassobacillus pellis]MBM7554514.1 RhtB (resistance to homoserine/threonine) family protein [Thalassobacillus pellis]